MKSGRVRRDLAGWSTGAPGAAAFVMLRALNAIGDWQFDRSVEFELLEEFADTADGSLSAEGLILYRRSGGETTAITLEDCSAEDSFLLVHLIREGESTDKFLPGSGELRRRVLEVTSGLPLLSRGEARGNRAVRRVYREGDEVGTLAFDEMSYESAKDCRRRIEMTEFAAARPGEFIELLGLLEKRMQDAVEPELFESPSLPASEPPPRELPALPEAGSGDPLALRALEASLRFAERGTALVLATPGVPIPEDARLARECLFRARMSLEFGEGLVDEDMIRDYAKGLRRLASLLRKITTVDICKARFSDRKGRMPRGGEGFAAHLAEIRERGANDLRRHLAGTRYQRFQACFRGLLEAPGMVIQADHPIPPSAPRLMGERAEALVLAFHEAARPDALPRDLREALGAVRRILFMLEFLAPALGRGAVICREKLERPAAELVAFVDALSCAEVSRSWLSGSGDPVVDAAAARFLARSHAEAARIMESRAGILSVADRQTFRRSLALASYGLC